MLEAGAHVLETDTFQASRLKLSEWGLDAHTHEINLKAAEIARRAAGDDRFVAGSIGPTGFLPASDDPSLGQIQFPELAEVFREQAVGLLAGGVDLIIIETAQDILEVKAAVFGAREAFKEAGREVPIQCSVSLLPQGGKMLLGTDISAVLATLEALDIDAIGLNCSTGPEDMRDAIRCRCRDPTARRSSPSSPSRWPTCWASSSSATGSRSSAAAAARRRRTSRCWPTASRAAPPASAPLAAPPTSRA
jgi:5-methyltetrahydrofolate--homocysteine methyltransferase